MSYAGALRALRAWLTGAHPPATERALPRGCRIEPDTVCEALLAAALRARSRSLMNSLG